VDRRRGVLKLLGGALVTLLGAAIAVPAAAFFSFPTRKRTVGGADEPIDVGALGAIPEGRPVRVRIQVGRLRDAWNAFANVTLGAAWIIRDGDQVRAFSTVCPHAGCAVDWSPDAKQFKCPCHASVFAPDGSRVSGPAPRGLDPLECAVDGGRVRVTWRRYRQGVPGREET
jgi:Rieske Fe-S protein